MRTIPTIHCEMCGYRWFNVPDDQIAELTCPKCEAGMKIDLTREETLGLIELLNTIVDQTKGELEDPSLDHPQHKTSAPIKPLLRKLLNGAINAEWVRVPPCFRPKM